MPEARSLSGSHQLKDFFRSVRYPQAKLGADLRISQALVNKILQGHTDPSPALEAGLYAKARELGYDGPVPETLKECPVCGRIVENDGNGACCNDCKGFRQPAEGAPRVVAREERPCRRCGKPVVPYRHGAVLVKTVCKACLFKSTAARRTILGLSQDDVTILAVDLRELGLEDQAPRIRTWLGKEAQRNLRSMEAQIVFCILEKMRETDG